MSGMMAAIKPVVEKIVMWAPYMLVPLLALMVIAQSATTITVAKYPHLLAYCTPGVATTVGNLIPTTDDVPVPPAPVLLGRADKKRSMVAYNSLMLSLGVGALVAIVYQLVMYGKVLAPMSKNLEFWNGVLG